MELEGLKRSLLYLKEKNVKVTDLTTDRHVQIRKYVRTEEPNIRHWFDCWHISKSVYKKLAAVSKKKGCESIAPWTHSISNHLYWAAASSSDEGQLARAKWASVSNHVVDVHKGHSEHFPSCEHGVLDERQWILKGSKAHKELKDIVLNPRLLKDIHQLSPAEQTSQLESYHKVVCQFVPKFQHFFYDAMKARILLAVLHNNENAYRKQARKRDGTPFYKVSYPREKQGSHVLNRVKEDCTYGYVKELLDVVLSRRQKLPTYRDARVTLMTEEKPLNRAALEAKCIDVTTAIEQYKSRFTPMK